MAINISTDLQNALNNPERYGAVLLTFTLGSNVYGLYNGTSKLTYNTIDYYGGASVLEVDNIQEAADGSVSELVLRLNAQPDKGLTVDVLQSFYDEDWQFGRVHIQFGLLHPETGAPIGLTTLLKGSIFEAPLKKGPRGHLIEARVVSQSVKLSENGGRYRNSATQRLFDPTDTSMDGIGSLGGATKKELKWGQG